MPYNKPFVFIFFAIIGSAVQGVMMPIYGWFYVKILFNTLFIDMDEVEFWILFVLMLAAISFVATYVYKVMFGVIGENMTLAVRRSLFRSLVYKHIGWFDHKEHSSGALTTLLSEDVQALNGASTEGAGSQLEAMLGLLLGLVLSFVFEWKMALLALAISPPLLITNIFLAKMQTGLVDTNDKDTKVMQVMISDAVTNQKTVASFGFQHLLVNHIE